MHAHSVMQSPDTAHCQGTLLVNLAAPWQACTHSEEGSRAWQEQVAEALSRTKESAVEAHARDELGIDIDDAPSPVQVCADPDLHPSSHWWSEHNRVRAS
jgi:hypothetical protein